MSPVLIAALAELPVVKHTSYLWTAVKLFRACLYAHDSWCSACERKLVAAAVLLVQHVAASHSHGYPACDAQMNPLNIEIKLSEQHEV